MTYICFLIIKSKWRPSTAKSPYFITSLLSSGLFIKVFKLIHNGIPETIYNSTHPKLQTSITQELL